MLQNKICRVGHSFPSNTLFPRKIIGYAFTGVENPKNRIENNSWLLQINKLLYALAIWVYDWSSTTTSLDRRLRTTRGSHNYKNIHTRSYSTYSELYSSSSCLWTPHLIMGSYSVTSEKLNSQLIRWTSESPIYPLRSLNTPLIQWWPRNSKWPSFSLN